MLLWLPHHHGHPGCVMSSEASVPSYQQVLSYASVTQVMLYKPYAQVQS